MDPLPLVLNLAWSALPSVRLGSSGRPRRVSAGAALTPVREANVRAGHAHARVLLVLSLASFVSLGWTNWPEPLRRAAGRALFVGILAQSGGRFLHRLVGAPSQASTGATLAAVGAVLPAATVLLPADGRSPPSPRGRSGRARPASAHAGRSPPGRAPTRPSAPLLACARSSPARKEDPADECAVGHRASPP